MWSRARAWPVGAIAGLLSLGLGAFACTPLGGWLYSDPTFSLSGVSTKYRGVPADTLQMVLTGCNLNDFDVNFVAVEGTLVVDGQALGSLHSDKPAVMKLRDSSDFLVPLQIPRAEEPPVHAKGDDMLSAHYELSGRVELSTPIGVRRVVLYQKGDVHFDSAGVASGWTVRNARPCKPGQSIIPGQSIKTKQLIDTIFGPPPPRQVNPNRPGDY
jgi:hypothetical protein